MPAGMSELPRAPSETRAGRLIVPSRVAVVHSLWLLSFNPKPSAHPQIVVSKSICKCSFKNRTHISFDAVTLGVKNSKWTLP